MYDFLRLLPQGVIDLVLHLRPRLAHFLLEFAAPLAVLGKR